MLLIDKIDRKKLQLSCFVILTVLYVIMGVAYNQIRCTSMWLFIVIFMLSQFVSNAGPNTTVFVIPAEVFETKYRSTAYGLSAAIGKAGGTMSQRKLLKKHKQI